MTERGRIDMTHGFMKIIIKNQLDRDTYHKEVTDEKMNPKPPRFAESNHRARKPDRGVYHPPKQAAPNPKEKEIPQTSEIVSQKEADEPIPLFKLEYEDAGKTVHNLLVWEKSNLAELCHSFANQVGLDPPLEAALHRRLEEEYDKFKT